MRILKKLFNLEGRVAIVAGGSGVIGNVMAYALAAAGAKVAIWGRSEATVNAALDTLKKRMIRPAMLTGQPVDTASEKAVEAAVNRVQQNMGLPTILINAVGGNRDCSNFVNTDMTQFERILELNLTAGLVIPCKILSRLWIDRKSGGSILNLASMASFQLLPGIWAYKAGLLKGIIAV